MESVRDFELYIDGESLTEIVNREAKIWYNFFVTKNIQLYHYTSQQGLDGILSSNSLWFSDAENLNDKSEGKYIYTLLDKFLTSYSKGNEFEIFKNEIRKSILEIDDKYIFSYKSTHSRFASLNMFPHYFICSFCKDDDALAMWNYYSKSENKIGYNVKFSLQELWKSVFQSCNSTLKLPSEIRAYKVLYSLRSQRKFLRKVLDFYYNIWRKSNSKNLVLSNLAQYLHAIKFAVKHPAFAPEKEVRLIIKVVEKNFDLSSGKIKVRATDAGFVPYIPVSFAKVNIKQIKASPLTDNHESVKYLLQQYGYEGVKVDKSEIPLRY